MGCMILEMIRRQTNLCSEEARRQLSDQLLACLGWIPEPGLPEVMLHPCWVTGPVTALMGPLALELGSVSNGILGRHLDHIARQRLERPRGALQLQNANPRKQLCTARIRAFIDQ